MSAFLKSLSEPSELMALLEYKFMRPAAIENPAINASGQIVNEARFQCYYYLNRTSRSFAAVIKELDQELMDPVCLFYLVLRGLDTIEDDMTLPLDRKVKLLQTFHTVIHQQGWTFNESGPNEKDRDLLVNFHYVIEHFLTLPKAYQDVITDITKRMGFGMAEFCTRKVESKEDYNKYCHYVAGLVGIGLSRLFAVSKLEDESFNNIDELANSMGLFLQKTNIIRDFHEDLLEGRLFWPKEIWSKYCNDPKEFCDEKNIDKALACLNHLCMDVLEHIPDAIDYMSKLRNQSVFNFCAIPQVMAISTIALVFNNPEVFKRNVKIRKGLACKLILEAQTITDVRAIFLDFLNEMARKNNNPFDPNYVRISSLISQVRYRLYRRSLLDMNTLYRFHLPLGVLCMVIQSVPSFIWRRDSVQLLYRTVLRRFGPTSPMVLRLTGAMVPRLFRPSSAKPHPLAVFFIAVGDRHIQRPSIPRACQSTLLELLKFDDDQTITRRSTETSSIHGRYHCQNRLASSYWCRSHLRYPLRYRRQTGVMDGFATYWSNRFPRPLTLVCSGSWSPLRSMVGYVSRPVSPGSIWSQNSLDVGVRFVQRRFSIALTASTRLLSMCV